MLKDDSDIIIRAKNFEDMPDVEMYIQKLESNGMLKKLAEEKKLTVDELKTLPIDRLAEVFYQKNQELESGDVIIFVNSGDFEVFTD